MVPSRVPMFHTINCKTTSSFNDLWKCNFTWIPTCLFILQLSYIIAWFSFLVNICLKNKSKCSQFNFFSLVIQRLTVHKYIWSKPITVVRSLSYFPHSVFKHQPASAKKKKKVSSLQPVHPSIKSSRSMHWHSIRSNSSKHSFYLPTTVSLLKSNRSCNQLPASLLEQVIMIRPKQCRHIQSPCKTGSVAILTNSWFQG